MTQPVLTARAADRITLVRTLWQEVLEVDEVPEDTNFFDAGGDSLLLVALVERIRQASGQSVRTMDVLRAGTVRGQAELLAAGTDVVTR